jgi:hypothetical protein
MGPFFAHSRQGAERRHARRRLRPLQRFREDFALMRSLGIRNYRLSIAWPRIFPSGDGALNQAGLDFYRRLVDAMAENGITPWVTLFHWDLPQALEDRGGWTSRTTVDAFATYADTVVGALSGKVKNWISLNEIRCFTVAWLRRRRLQGPRPDRAGRRGEPDLPPRACLPRARGARGSRIRGRRRARRDHGQLRHVHSRHRDDPRHSGREVLVRRKEPPHPRSHLPGRLLRRLPVGGLGRTLPA